LFLNGKSLGSKSLPPDAPSRNGDVPLPQERSSCRFERRRIVATQELRTAGAPAESFVLLDRER
jgi:hypothetical protein